MANTFVPHPSVRIKGTETTYLPVQCYDPLCADKAPHMHCPFCVKTESYTDPVILKAHYRVKHVDKGIEFAGLKVLRCCEQCDIVGVIKGEKKFKGAHWHCYKCRNGFNRRDEAIKHYRTHFRNPQTTFQIQIAQDINQPVSHAYETDEATASIPTEVYTNTSMQDNGDGYPAHVGLPVIRRDNLVSMPGVGAVETVGISEAQTIMIIQDENMATLQETPQDLQQSDNDGDDLESEHVPSSTDHNVRQLWDRISELEKELAEKDSQIKSLNNVIEQQNVKLTLAKQREQELVQKLNSGSNKSVEELCQSLENQHKELIQTQLKQLEETIRATPSKPTKMIIINPLAGNSGISAATSLLTSNANIVSSTSAIEQAVNVQTYTVSSDLTDSIQMGDTHQSVLINHVQEQETLNELHGDEDSALLGNTKDPNYEVILDPEFESSTGEDHLDNSKDRVGEPANKKARHDIECQNL